MRAYINIDKIVNTVMQVLSAEREGFPPTRDFLEIWKSFELPDPEAKVSNKAKV